MAAVKSFLKTTVAGGLVFLVPLVVLVIVLRHAMRLVGPFADSIAARFPAHEIAGVAIATLVAVLLLVLVSFVAGLLARTAAGRKAVAWLENSLFGRLPQYRMLKAMAEGFAHVEGGRGLTPVLVNVDLGWQAGYQLESLQDGWVAVFLPQAPSPVSGNILYVPANKVRALNIPLREAMSLVRCMGVGSRHALRGVDLTLPRED